ncbi:MAG TPA: hypothetical protein VGO62_11115 [Myxococcota bacterium]
MRLLPIVVVSSAALISALYSSPALARHGGLYLELAPSWGFYSSTEAVIESGRAGGPDSYNFNVPTADFVPAIKVGFNLFGWAGAEAHVTGHYWDPNGDTGGAGYVGGVVRITPLEALSYIIPDDVEIPSLVPSGPVKWKDRPFDLGISFGGGYTITGEDYAYQGGYFQWGFDLKFYVTPNFALGLDFPFRNLLYEPFRYSNYKDHLGYCTDGGSAFVTVNGGKTRITVPDGAGEGGPAIAASDQKTACPGAKAPSAFFFAPAFTIAGVFDFGI